MSIKKFLSIFSAFFAFLIFEAFPCVNAEGVELETASPSYILIEKETGTVMLEKDADAKRPMASVTKIMTALLTLEEIEKGNLSLSDKLYASANASKMGGSQIFLRENEEMDVDTLLKTVFVASANDSCVVLAERVGGSVEGFVNMMNQKAEKLGLQNTHFDNPHGLDSEAHYSSARDLSIISKELLKYDIRKYTTIWQDSIRDGAFILSNTNKLIRFYPNATGLKTGSTGNAGFCISATAEKNNMELIAVTLGASTSKERFDDAKMLLDYGFSKYKILTLCDKDQLTNTVEVAYGAEKTVDIFPKESKKMLISSGDNSKTKTVTELYPLTAPVKKGDLAGKTIFLKNGEEADSVDLICSRDIDKKSWFDTFGEFFGGI